MTFEGALYPEKLRVEGGESLGHLKEQLTLRSLG